MRSRRTAETASVNIAALASAARRGEVDTDVELAIAGTCLVLAGTITVQLETTRVASGGLRLWARCSGCSARAAVLYLAAPGLRCRRCAGLVYPATRQRPEERVLEQALARRTKARAALGAGPDPREPIPRRPQGVRFSSWVRRLDELHEAQAAVQAALAALVGRLGARSGALAQDAGSPSPAPPAAPTPETPSREGRRARGT
ncbi:hypothetical protein BE20_11355 [Sorangium cellulosum]|uniref:Uncharacterized protein n=1 Tax=Sorangium cellulosum TaxID=56 RepID=A0A150SJI0_SORCE|nr:hypothetical protein BE20_11355 [Sorangium cellulosum]KYF99010.1 hypothetical protein BE18_28455 [Sorangium cellulosum]